MAHATNRVVLCSPGGGGDLGLEVEPDGNCTLTMTFAMDDGATVVVPAANLRDVLDFLREATALVESKLASRT